LEVAQHARGAVLVHRLYIVVDKGGLEMTDIQAVATAMQAACAGHVSAYKSTLLSGMELDSDRVAQDIAAFGADGVLWLRPRGGVVSAYGGYFKLNFDVTLRNVESDRIVWAARAANEGGTAMIEKRNRLAAERIVEQLVKEGLLSGGTTN